jgi:2-methylcitrate dehydratase PrpD
LKLKLCVRNVPYDASQQLVSGGALMSSEKNPASSKAACTLTRALAEFAADTPAEAVPARLLEKAANAFTDTLGVGLAGSLEPASVLVSQWVQEEARKGRATVWGSKNGVSPAEAALANGTASHALDFDDSLPSMRSHPSASLVPAALAVAEVQGASGREVLAAYVIGLEVAGKIGRVVSNGHFSRGLHTTATIGIFSCATAAARLLRLDGPGLQTAWGIAASHAGGLARNFGTMTKPLHAGNAARIGVLSASLAQRGFTADTAIFDGANGFVASYGSEGGMTLEDAIQKLGKPWEIEDPGLYVKSWPCCYCNHRPIGGLFQLLDEHAIRTDEVKQISVGFLPGSDTALLSSNPMTGLEGKFSIEYSMAATLLDRRLTLETFTDRMVQRPFIRDLMRKVKRYRIEDPKVYSGLIGYTDIAIDTVRGRFETRVERTPGSPAWPISRENLVAKFLDCSARVLGSDGASELLAIAVKLPLLADVGPLLKATRPRHERPQTAHELSAG